jgi:signal transduction histidine kinase
MTIRTRLTLLFTLIVASLLGLFCWVIYLSGELHRKREFTNRLREEAFTSAELLFGTETFSPELFKLLDRFQITVLNQEEIIIYNPQNEVIYESGTDYLSLPEGVLEQVRQEKEVRLRQGNREIVGILFEKSSSPLVVFASAIDKYGFSKQNHLALILTGGWGLATLIVFLAGSFFAGQSLRPLNRVIGQIDRITASRLGLRVDEGNGRDEIAQLASRFNRMLERLEESFRLQQAFVSNASHQIRTPLTAITGQVEVALYSGDNEQEMRATLHSMLDDIRQLNRLTDGLLTLAGVSVDGVQVPFSTVRIDELLWQVQSATLKLKSTYRVRLELDDLPEDQKELELPGNEDLLHIALFNLMENGCKFSPDHTVSVRLQKQRLELSLVFHNCGPAIPAEELPLVFEAFHRGSNGRNARGHGIGLSLTDRIVRLHHGRISLVSEELSGTTITVTLPTAR